METPHTSGSSTEKDEDVAVPLGVKINEPPAAGTPATNGNNGKPKSTLKDYTTELPMFDLEESIGFTGEIHSQGLEKAKMPDVAKVFGYESANSTSFYRKLVAARHYGLLGANGAELTERARDYHAPTSDDSKSKALTEAVMGIPYFEEVLTQHNGKRLNVELLGNDISRKFNVSKTCGKRCAKVFETSIKFAGLLSPENFVLNSAAVKTAPAKEHDAEDLEDGEDTQKHTLYLDKQKRRKFQIVAPLTLTTADLERIKNWLTFTIIVDDE